MDDLGNLSSTINEFPAIKDFICWSAAGLVMVSWFMGKGGISIFFSSNAPKNNKAFKTPSRMMASFPFTYGRTANHYVHEQDWVNKLCHWILSVVAFWATSWKDELQIEYPEYARHNLRKLLKVFDVTKPMFYDGVWWLPGERMISRCKIREGYIGINLRFRKGNLFERRKGTFQEAPWSVNELEYSIPKQIPLESDGRLSVDRVRSAFNIEEVDFLIPGRYEVIPASKGELISPVMLYNLTQRFGFVNIVEREDLYCMLRRRFRQWLRSSFPCYIIRWIIFVTFMSTFVVAHAYFVYKSYAFIPQHPHPSSLPGTPFGAYEIGFMLSLLWWSLPVLGILLFTFNYQQLYWYLRSKRHIHDLFTQIPERTLFGALDEEGKEMFL